MAYSNNTIGVYPFAIIATLLAFSGFGDERGVVLHGSEDEQSLKFQVAPRGGVGISRPNKYAFEEPREIIEKLKPLHRQLGPVRSGDWLETHSEPGQTFDEYIKSRPIGASGKRRTIVIQPIGDFDSSQLKLLNLTSELMGLYFGLPVRVERGMPVDKNWPSGARRVHPTWGDKQLLSDYIIDDLLKPRLPSDAATYLGLTAWDLWPGKNWNFVFGSASIRDRVGVWSIYRNGNLNRTKEEFRTALLRTVKIATHETGHMFSMLHCTAYECNMCGSNSQEESDRRPLALCPECLAKLVRATGVDPVKRFQGLAEFSRLNGLEEEARFYKKSLAALKP
ncbi:MAG: hypothetical protein GY847_01325 [Proteobacteria bacterium]|nr:hypothetical protein [Pseudomonadota bacterium]